MDKQELNAECIQHPARVRPPAANKFTLCSRYSEDRRLPILDMDRMMCTCAVQVLFNVERTQFQDLLDYRMCPSTCTVSSGYERSEEGFICNQLFVKAECKVYDSSDWGTVSSWSKEEQQAFLEVMHLIVECPFTPLVPFIYGLKAFHGCRSLTGCVSGVQYILE